MQQTNTNNEIKETEVSLNWLDEEEKQLTQSKFDGERLDGLIIEEGKLTEFEILMEKPFEKWKDEQNKVIKVIIPVVKNDVKFNFWLNQINPTYHEIVKRLRNGQRKFRILRTGKMKQTRYQLVD
jgi:hypothetical protein